MYHLSLSNALLTTTISIILHTEVHTVLALLGYYIIWSQHWTVNTLLTHRIKLLEVVRARSADLISAVIYFLIEGAILTGVLSRVPYLLMVNTRYASFLIVIPNLCVRSTTSTELQRRIKYLFVYGTLLTFFCVFVPLKTELLTELTLFISCVELHFFVLARPAFLDWIHYSPRFPVLFKEGTGLTLVSVIIPLLLFVLAW
mmetsp:Transcript_39936/g.41603  ORF Transcript_39936/g.41603 Transcript_39936/m.41603 type:complete len:201 (-) Transcript_39936:259-861(-)